MSIVGPGCDQLDAFFDGELPADEQESFRQHLGACRRCQEVLGGRIAEQIVIACGAPERRPAEPGANARVDPREPDEQNDANDPGR